MLIYRRKLYQFILWSVSTKCLGFCYRLRSVEFGSYSTSSMSTVLQFGRIIKEDPSHSDIARTKLASNISLQSLKVVSDIMVVANYLKVKVMEALQIVNSCFGLVKEPKIVQIAKKYYPNQKHHFDESNEAHFLLFAKNAAP